MGANSSLTKSFDSPGNPPNAGELKGTTGAGSVRRRGVETVRQKPLHKGPVHSVCTVGETTIASAGADREVVVLNWTRRAVEARLTGPSKDVTQVCYNKNGSLIYGGSRDRSIHAWKYPIAVGSDAESAEPVPPNVTKMEGHSLGVTALDTSDAYPQLLCSGSRDNSVCLWDVDVGKPVSSMHVPRNLVTDLSWVPEEMAVAQASEDKSVRIWDLTSCSTVQHFRARNQLQLCCSVSEDKQYLLSGGSGCGPVGGQLVMWDRRNEKRPVLETHAHQDGVHGCRFINTHDKQLVCSVGGDSSVRVWDQLTLEEVCRGEFPEPGAITGVARATEDLLVCCSFSNGLSFWTLHGGSGPGPGPGPGSGPGSDEECPSIVLTFSCT